MKLFIPLRGTKLVLLKDWQFKPENNVRWANRTLLQYFNKLYDSQDWLLIPRGAELTVAALTARTIHTDSSYIKFRWRPHAKAHVVRILAYVDQTKDLDVEILHV